MRRLYLTAGAAGLLAFAACGTDSGGEDNLSAVDDDGGASNGDGSSTGGGGGDGGSSGGLNVTGGSGNADASTGDGGGSATGGGSGTGGSATGGSSGTIDGGNTTFPDVVFNYDAGPTVTPDACATVGGTAEEAPLAIYLMLDRSGSMNDGGGGGGFCLPPIIPCSGGGGVTKWQEATAGITQFVTDQASSGIGVALNYFSGDSCTSLSTPAVALGQLPGNSGAITTSLGNTSPGGSTNTEAALRGLIDFCSAHQGSTGERCIGVLISDGEPTRCTAQSATDLANIAANAYNNQNVQIFTIGMTGADFNVLNDIATAGGSDCDAVSANTACDVSSGAQAFIDALNGIRDSSIACEYQIPDTGRLLDLATVSVFFRGSNQVRQQIQGAASCAGAAGWIFDDPTDPQRIVLCDSTCTAVQSDGQAEIEVEIACEQS